jgi:hypothetical protein
MAAAHTTYLQLLIAVTWTGLRLEGSPPTFRPVNTPRTPADVEREKEEAEAERVYAARVASLRRFAPPPAEPFP